jgi:hypothetical protein
MGVGTCDATEREARAKAATTLRVTLGASRLAC